MVVEMQKYKFIIPHARTYTKGVIGCPARAVRSPARYQVVHCGRDWLPRSRRSKAHPVLLGALWPYLVLLLAPFTYILSFIYPPPSRTPPSSQFHLPSRAGMASYTHGAGAHVSDTQNFDVCVQPNTISFRTGPITKTTKHSKVHSLIMAGKSLDSHSIPAR